GYFDQDDCPTYKSQAEHPVIGVMLRSIWSMRSEECSQPIFYTQHNQMQKMGCMRPQRHVPVVGAQKV
ncbi:MAG: hypothetical protein ACI30C_04770, partial [Muribaculaceae bacterium]